MKKHHETVTAHQRNPGDRWEKKWTITRRSEIPSYVRARPYLTLDCVCKDCGQHFIHVQLPGQKKEICPGCDTPDRLKQLNRQRVAAYRARQKDTAK